MKGLREKIWKWQEAFESGEVSVDKVDPCRIQCSVRNEGNGSMEDARKYIGCLPGGGEILCVEDERSKSVD